MTSTESLPVFLEPLVNHAIDLSHAGRKFVCNWGPVAVPVDYASMEDEQSFAIHNSGRFTQIGFLPIGVNLSSAKAALRDFGLPLSGEATGEGAFAGYIEVHLSPASPTATLRICESVSASQASISPSTVFREITVHELAATSRMVIVTYCGSTCEIMPIKPRAIQAAAQPQSMVAASKSMMNKGFGDLLFDSFFCPDKVFLPSPYHAVCTYGPRTLIFRGLAPGQRYTFWLRVVGGALCSLGLAPPGAHLVNTDLRSASAFACGGSSSTRVHSATHTRMQDGSIRVWRRPGSVSSDQPPSAVFPDVSLSGFLRITVDLRWGADHTPTTTTAADTTTRTEAGVPPVQGNGDRFGDDDGLPDDPDVGGGGMEGGDATAGIEAGAEDPYADTPTSAISKRIPDLPSLLVEVYSTSEGEVLARKQVEAVRRAYERDDSAQTMLQLAAAEEVRLEVEPSSSEPLDDRATGRGIASAPPTAVATVPLERRAAVPKLVARDDGFVRVSSDQQGIEYVNDAYFDATGFPVLDWPRFMAFRLHIFSGVRVRKACVREFCENFRIAEPSSRIVMRNFDRETRLALTLYAGGEVLILGREV